MSNPPTPPTGRPPKTMSSRLMTMKASAPPPSNLYPKSTHPTSNPLLTYQQQFMQRAAAANPTPPSPEAHTPDPHPQTPPSKRRRTGDVSNNNTPASEEPTPQSDIHRIRVALEEERARREEAVERLAAEAGETKWVFSTVGGEEGEVGGEWAGRGLKVLRAGYSEIDCGAWGVGVEGRRSFGRVVDRGMEKRQNGTAGKSSSSESDGASGNDDDDDGDESDESDPTGTKDLVRASKEEAIQRAKAERKAKRKAEKAELVRLAEKRKKKEVKLNRLSSISGGGGVGGKPGGGRDDRECFGCGQKGHEKRDCPNRGRRTDGNGGGKGKRSREPLDY